MKRDTRLPGGGVWRIPLGRTAPPRPEADGSSPTPSRRQGAGRSGDYNHSLFQVKYFFKAS